MIIGGTTSSCTVGTILALLRVRRNQGCALGSGYFTRNFPTFNPEILGLLYIEKISDGSQGWVPGWVTRETESDHRRAKNFKQRYQFLKALAEMDMAE